MENIGKFLESCEHYGCNKQDLFQTVDLYEAENMPQVHTYVGPIHKVGRKHAKLLCLTVFEALYCWPPNKGVSHAGIGIFTHHNWVLPLGALNVQFLCVDCYHCVLHAWARIWWAFYGWLRKIFCKESAYKEVSWSEHWCHNQPLHSEVLQWKSRKFLISFVQLGNSLRSSRSTVISHQQQCHCSSN